MTEAVPAVRSVALGFWIASGSRGESDQQAGLSHLIEHLLFKGSARYSSLEIDQLFDGIGADINAGTSKESTSVYARVISEHLPEAFDAVADMVLHPTLEEIDSEREVILEEIAMYEDDPQEKIFDLLGAEIFAGDPLGRAIVGTAEVVSSTPSEVIRDFHRTHYTPERIVIAAAGATNHQAVVELAQSLTPEAGTQSAPSFDAASLPRSPGVCFEAKDTEQFHVAIGGPGLSRHDERRFALRVLDTVLGGSSSSRLFQEIRERHGLAYSVFSFASAFSDTGQIGLYVGTRGDNLERAMSVIGAEIARVRRDPADAGELERAKENIKGRMALSLESTGARMNRIGAETLAGTELLDIDEVIERVDAVSVDDLAQLASELWDPAKLSVVGIGADEERFAAAREQLIAAW